MPSPHADQAITLAVDTVIFTVIRHELNVLLIQMKKKPYAGQWAFPGGLIATKETLEHAARRMLKDQTGVADVYLEQLATFDQPKRDVLGRVVSTAYFALMPNEGVTLRTTDRYAAIRWWPVKKLPKLAYDHGHMAKVALDRLRAKLGYTNIVRSLLPTDLTLTDLQQTYESILGRTLDKRNFRKKILALELLETSGKKRKGESYRPASLYRFKKKHLVNISVV